MGYYAEGNGSMTFAGLAQDSIESIKELLEDEYTVEDVSPCSTSGETVFCFYSGEKYHDDTVKTILLDVAKHGRLLAGEIEYYGEDRSIWRFIFVPNYGWIEQNGYVEFPSVEEDIARNTPPVSG